jgi:hypothetical protein
MAICEDAADAKYILVQRRLDGKAQYRRQSNSFKEPTATLQIFF